MTFSKTIEEFIEKGYFWTPLDYFQVESGLDYAVVPPLVKHAEKNNVLKLEFRVICKTCGNLFLRVPKELLSKKTIRSFEIECKQCGTTNRYSKNEVIIDLFFNISEFNDITPPKVPLEETQRLHLENLFERSINSEKPDEKGKLFESFTKDFLSLIPGLNFIESNVRTESSEIDIVFWIEPGLSMEIGINSNTSNHCIVQAKNWKNTVGVEAIDHLVIEANLRKAKLAILFTRSHLSKDAKNRIMRVFDSMGVFIIYFELNDIEKVLKGVETPESLFRKKIFERLYKSNR